jgi:uncharacterized protein YaeQ
VLETLAKDMPRVIKWDVMISGRTIFVTDDRGQHEVQLHGWPANAADRSPLDRVMRLYPTY